MKLEELDTLETKDESEGINPYNYQLLIIFSSFSNKSVKANGMDHITLQSRSMLLGFFSNRIVFSVHIKVESAVFKNHVFTLIRPQ